MKTLTTITAVRKALAPARREGKTIGFVPTMGKLHDGHLSLVRRCRRDNDLTVVSIFVNPAQFAPGEDYAAYPRDKKNDIFLLRRENVDIILYPSEKVMYPDGNTTRVTVKNLSQRLCGEQRPGHFDGVATVVTKLLNIVQPSAMYLGEKDAQQCVVIRKMVQDLDFPVKIVTVPTVRDKDGLAMSSRNTYLSRQQRKEATVLYRSLQQAKKAVTSGERDGRRLIHSMQAFIEAESSGAIDYIACVDAATLEPLNVLKGRVLIALAVRFGQARLIDNITLRVS